jgi:hypothetical protein
MNSFYFVEPSLHVMCIVFIVMVHQNIQVLAKGNGCSGTLLWRILELSHFQCGLHTFFYGNGIRIMN